MSVTKETDLDFPNTVSSLQDFFLLTTEGSIVRNEDTKRKLEEASLIRKSEKRLMSYV